VRVVNTGESEPLVILKHFGPNNPDAKLSDAEPLRRKNQNGDTRDKA